VKEAFAKAAHYAGIILVYSPIIFTKTLPVYHSLEGPVEPGE
jgi:hypothetical protein